MDLRNPLLNLLFDTWLDEDIGRGDLTTQALHSHCVSAHWIAKQKGIFCGGAIVERLFQKLDKSIKINLLIKDGESFQENQKLLTLNGPAPALVAGERTTLNIAMHLSGIATETASLVAKLKGSGIHLADTRKTTPGLRILEKYAVRCGGGINHRLGLDDAAMLKENHLAWSDSVENAIKVIRKTAPWTSKIIVEAETPEQAEKAVTAGADAILLDEISPTVIKQLVPHLRAIASLRSHSQSSNQIVIEASGIKPIDFKAYLETGIDLISSSAPITKSTWLDFSMRFDKTCNDNL